MHKLL